MKAKKLFAFMLAIVVIISQIAIPVNAENTQDTVDGYYVHLFLLLDGGTYNGSNGDAIYNGMPGTMYNGMLAKYIRVKYIPSSVSQSITVADPIRDGYTFLGWAEVYDFLGEGSLFKSTLTLTEKPERVFIAKWEENPVPIAKVFTIDFKPNANGEQSHSMPDQQVTIGSSDTINKNDYIRSGYTFTGWNTKSDGTGTAYKDQAPAGKITTKNGATVVLYAQWTVSKVFTIDFKPNANGEQSHSMPDQQVKIGSSDTINKNNYIRPGYTFTGWNTKSDGTGTAYKDQAPAGKITNKSGATVVLYAQWASTSKTFTIDFKPNANKEQSRSMPNQQVKIGSSDTINKNLYVRSGYTFAGWNTKSDGTGTAYKDQAPAGKITTKNGATVVLYAQWAPEKPSIKLNSIGNVSYGNACNITGTVSSNQKLYSVSGVIISGSTSVQWYTQYFTDSDTKTLDLKNSEINMNLKFGKLPRGSYILRITAINWNGKSETASISFKIVLPSTFRNWAINARPLSLEQRGLLLMLPE